MEYGIQKVSSVSPALVVTGSREYPVFLQLFVLIGNQRISSVSPALVVTGSREYPVFPRLFRISGAGEYPAFLQLLGYQKPGSFLHLKSRETPVLPRLPAPAFLRRRAGSWFIGNKRVIEYNYYIQTLLSFTKDNVIMPGRRKRKV